jgi:hypothetical protein
MNRWRNAAHIERSVMRGEHSAIYKTCPRPDGPGRNPKSAASTRLAKQSPLPVAVCRHGRSRTYILARLLLLVLLANTLDSVPAIIPSRLRRFSKLVAHCAGLRVTQERERREKGGKRQREREKEREKGTRECNRCTVAEKESARSRRNSRFESVVASGLISPNISSFQRMRRAIFMLAAEAFQRIRS